jgi:hypothetical protein
MKTMKFLAVLALLSFSMNTMAQNVMQQKVKANKAALKEKASKDAKKEAKRLQKLGWTVFPGGLPLEKQLDRVYMYQEDYDDDMNHKYIIGENSSVAETLPAAQAQATELARMDLASQIGSEVTGLVENMLANKMLADDQAASITTTLIESKSIFSQKLGRVEPVLKLMRVNKENKNKEVMVRLVAKKSSIDEIAKQFVRDELEKQGKEMSEELKAYLGKD